MMTLKNKIFFLAVAFAVTCMPMTAQPPRGGHRAPTERGRGGLEHSGIRQEAERYITLHAGLTPDEARRFFPKFHDMKARQRDIRGKIRRAMERVENGRLTDQDAHRILAEVRRLRRQEADLDAEAYVRFEQILPPRKLLKVMHADHELRRKMFKNGPRH